MEINKIKNSTISLLCVVLLFGCSDENGESNNRIEDDNPIKTVNLSDQSRSISLQLLDFYPTVTSDIAEFIDSKVYQSGNFVVSPLSLSMSLAMISNAVEDELQQEILSYLGVENLDVMNELSSTFLTDLPGLDKKTEMTFANSVWVEDSREVNDDFTNLVNDFYYCDIDYFSWKNPQKGVTQINDWISNKTNGKFNDYINDDKLNGIMALLINVLSFKSEWSYPNFFEESNTKNRIFYGYNVTRDVPTMESSEKMLNCYFDEYFTYVMVPFGNHAYMFEILLPTSEIPIDFNSDIMKKQLSIGRSSKMEYKKVTLQLPKFKMDFEVRLNEVLKKAGIEHFDVCQLKLFTENEIGAISVRQKVLFEINEKGAEATVTSSSSFGVTATRPDYSVNDPIRINVDHPFMFFITEQSTGAVVVSGRVADL